MLRQLIRLCIVVFAGVFMASVGYKITESLLDQRYVGHSRDVWGR